MKTHCLLSINKIILMMKINLNTIKKVVVSLFIAAAFISSVFAQKTPEETTKISFPKTTQFSDTKLTYKITDAPNKTFGYDIYAGDHKMIHQSSVPGLPGNEGFKTRVAAVKVADLVKQKIRKGEMPPTITIGEMKKLKAIK